MSTSNSSGALRRCRADAAAGGGAPIPQRHDQLRVRLERIAKQPRQAEIAHFQRAGVVEQQIGRLQVAAVRVTGAHHTARRGAAYRCTT
jgi:hypothetical protein